MQLPAVGENQSLKQQGAGGICVQGRQHWGWSRCPSCHVPVVLLHLWVFPQKILGRRGGCEKAEMVFCSPGSLLGVALPLKVFFCHGAYGPRTLLACSFISVSLISKWGRGP